MQKIVPHLWFDKEAKQAAAFYTSVFDGGNIISSTVLRNTPSGNCDLITFQIEGQEFMCISAGPYFKLNPSISFFVNVDPAREANPKEKINRLWAALSEGGKVLMPLGEYSFSKWYGWVEDKFGVSWQLILTDPAGEPRPTIVPSMLFVGDVYGKAEEALNFYVSVFAQKDPNAKAGLLAHYPEGMEPEKPDTLMFGDFQLHGQWFAAMDSAQDHTFAFSEAVSLVVRCETQEEIDYYWEKLSAVPAAEQCGWLKDRFGVSWQIVPTMMDEVMQSGDEEKIARVTKAFLGMKKFDIAELRKASS